MNPLFIAAPAALATAAGVAAYGAVSPSAQLFGPTICRTNSPRKLALTFDDGPNPTITPKLLDLLDRQNARATFFVIGAFAREYPDLVREISARGHVVGNHTETHSRLIWLRPPEIFVELRLGRSAITDALGVPPKWFRPPWGMRNPWLAGVTEDFNMRVVLWTLLPGDWRAKSKEWLVRRMLPIAARAKNAKQSGTGDILCLHDGDHRRQNGDRTLTLAALEHWLPRWGDLGLEFVTIDDAVDGVVPAS